MEYGVWKFISNCASSKVGRFVFAAYLIYLISMIGYAYGHSPYTAYPFRFFGEREIFELLNSPQLAVIRSSRFVFRWWQPSQFTDALLAVYIALPWWVYGYLGELVWKRATDSSPREAQCFSTTTQPKSLTPASCAFEIETLSAETISGSGLRRP